MADCACFCFTCKRNLDSGSATPSFLSSTDTIALSPLLRLPPASTTTLKLFCNYLSEHSESRPFFAARYCDSTWRTSLIFGTSTTTARIYLQQLEGRDNTPAHILPTSPPSSATIAGRAFEALLRTYTSINTKDAAKHLHQTQREAQEREGSISGGLTFDGGAMQPVPSGVFQELQQQGEAEAEESNLKSRAQSRGGRGVRAAASEESSTSQLLSRGRVTSAQESPVFVEAGASPRQSSRESSPVLARRGISQYESASAPVQAAAIERQESGPGASTPSPWPRATPSISPQLVGGSTGSNASILTPSPDSLAEYRSKMRLMIASTPLPLGPTSPQSLTLPTTPGSQRSHHSFSTISSISSQESHASSFAYGLRRSKPDLRLLRKGSKPSQHLIPKPSVTKAALRDPRSTSFYTPKVVDDTGLLESTTKNVTPHTSPAKPLPLTLPELLQSEPPMKPLSKVQTFCLHHAQSKRKASVTALRPTTSRPALPRAPSSQQFVTSMPPGASPLRLSSKAYRQLRFEESGRLSKDDHNTPVLELPSKAVNHPEVPSGAKSSKHVEKHHGMKPAAKHYHDVTPPEEEPGMTRASVFHQGDSYFHTWNTETMHSKEFIPARTPAESETYTPRVGIESRAPLGNASRDLPKTATGLSTASNSKKRKSSALFSLFRKTAFKEEIDYSASRKQGKPRRARPVPATRTGTPGITISSPADSHSVRNRSIVPELHAPSYFARPRIYRDDSDQSVARSPGHASTGYGTYEENVAEDVPPTPYSSQSRRRNRSSSEALSPMALPRRRPHLRHKRTLASSTDSFDTGRKASPDRLHLSAIASEAGSGASNKWSIPPVDAARIRATTSTVIVGSAADDLKEMRSQTLTFQEPGLRKKSSVWKGLMHGLRRVSSLGVSSPSFEGALQDHKGSILKRISVPSLHLRASRSSVNVRNGKLVRKVSRGSHVFQQTDSEDERKVQAYADEKVGEGRHSQSSPERPSPISITAEDLVVTEFEQTPFSKRYYDSIRSEQQAIRALIDETMEEDDEADDEVVLGFEQNVPDHLPNSPLCPLHPKHRSGGKAICPSHGRYKPKKARPSPRHKVEIVFDTSEDVVQRSIQSDGTALLASRLETISQSFFNVDRRRIQTSSMGSDGAESFMVQIEVSDARSGRHEQRSSGHRGRALERGESAMDIRLRRHRQRRQWS